jgi:acetyltransferase-like isoleucine patch superfamily enzyme
VHCSDEGVNLTGGEEQDLQELAAVGNDVRIDPTARIFGLEHVSIGSHVRIDCYTVITAGPEPVIIGDHVHLGVGVCLFGTAGIEIGDFASLSGRVAVYSTNDDFVGGHLVGPTAPRDLRNVHASRVVVGSHAVVGAGSVILPGVSIGRGAAVGALSLVKREVAEGEVAAGIPARPIGVRNLERLNSLDERARTAAADD